MARLLFPTDDPWFDELRMVSTYSEAELEKMILAHVNTVFPQYITIPFKKVLNIPTVKKGRAPDLAIISEDYNEWWIIEVETDEDDFSHVKAQIQVFSNYDYNSLEIAKYILSKDSTRTLHLDKLIKMVRDVKPQVLVMVDEISYEWEKEIINLGAQICVFQVYKNKDGSHAFRINGNYPKIFNADKSHCEFIKSPANILEIHQPDWFVLGVGNMLKKKSKSFKFFSRKSWIDLIKNNSSNITSKINGTEKGVENFLPPLWLH